MKKVAIALLLCVVVLVAVLLVAARNLNSYLDANRPWIEEQLEAAVGRPVEIGGLGASIGWGVSAEIRDLAVADDPAYSKESFLRAGEAVARVSLLPLLSGRVEIGQIEIRRPEIRVIQSAKGMNLDSLGGGPDGSPPASAAEEAGGAANAAAVAIALFRIADGTLLYRDTSVQPTSEVEVGGLDVAFRSDGNLESFRGQLEVDAAKVRMRSGESEDDQWEPVRLRADLSRDGDILEIRNADLRAAGLRLSGEATIRGLSGEPAVDATFSSPGGEVAGIPFAGLDGAFRYAGQRANIESLVLQVFGGTVTASGVYNLRVPGQPSFSLDTAIEGVRVEQAVATQAPGAAGYFEGGIQSQLKLTGAGADWAALRPKLRGGGEFHLIDGVLRKINLAASALGGLEAVPGLADLVDAELRAKYPALFGGEDTRFERADAVLQIGEGAVQVVELALEARDFAIEGAGRIGLDGALDLPTRLVCSEALSADLVARQASLAALRNAANRVAFPLRVRGDLPTVRASPDVTAIAKAIGRDRARDLLSRALGSTQGEGEPSTTEGEPAAAQDTGKELLKKGLDSLFNR